MRMLKDKDSQWLEFLPVFSFLAVISSQYSVCGKIDEDHRRPILPSSLDVKNAFEKHKIISDGLIPRAPDRFMVVKFRNNSTVELGNFLTFDEAWEIPGFIYWDADPGCIHTLIFLNIDHPNEFFPKKRQYLQWLVGNIPEARIENGRILSSYLMPIPPPVQYGTHRLMFLAYKQPRTTIEFSEPFLPALPLPKSRANWTLAEFVNKYDLIGPVAGNFYQINWQKEGNNLKDDKSPKIENKISL